MHYINIPLFCISYIQVWCIAFHFKTCTNRNVEQWLNSAMIMTRGCRCILSTKSIPYLSICFDVQTLIKCMVLYITHVHKQNENTVKSVYMREGESAYVCVQVISTTIATAMKQNVRKELDNWKWIAKKAFRQRKRALCLQITDIVLLPCNKQLPSRALLRLVTVSQCNDGFGVSLIFSERMFLVHMPQTSNVVTGSWKSKSRGSRQRYDKN